MDKKNTMLLTVVAIATLLVAVVGATFAYYSVTSSNLTGSTAVNTQTGTTGTIAMTSSGNSLCINMPVSNMANHADAYGTYYANTTCAPSTQTAATHNLATIVSTNSAASQTYSCTFNATVTMEDNGGASGTYDALGDDDGEYIFTLPSGVTITGVTSGTGIGLATLKNFGTKAGTATVSGDQSLTITGQMTFKNLESTAQNDLKGANFDVTVEFSNFECTSAIGS